ncbi:MAG: hypothetical protein J0L52_07910 [Caulobacterales bacterium]|nr:hypothetical protein [Caulobacterales bacterium]
MKRLLLCLALVFAPAVAKAMPVSEFLAEAEDIPHNPSALLRSDARRLMGEAQAAFATVVDERRAAVAAGRTPGFCPPEGARFRISAEELLARLNSIPPSRRHISVTQAVREWMADRYPC